jgi:hypothetical protein
MPQMHVVNTPHFSCVFFGVPMLSNVSFSKILSFINELL